MQIWAQSEFELREPLRSERARLAVGPEMARWEQDHQMDLFPAVSLWVAISKSKLLEEVVVGDCGLDPEEETDPNVLPDQIPHRLQTDWCCDSA